MIEHEKYTFTIPAWAVCAIEYGDFSGLSDTDESQVNEFTEMLNERFGHRLFSIEYGQEVYFRNFNDFHNLGDDCVDCKVFVTVAA